MPISEDDWERGATDEPADADRSYDTEEALVVAFLGEHPGEAFTPREILEGADLDASPEGDAADGGLASTAARLLDVASGVAGTTLVAGDVDEALADLREDGVVEAREVETGDGETETYYRLADHSTVHAAEPRDDEPL